MIWLKIVGAVMVLVPFGVLFVSMAQTDGTPFAIKSFLIGFGVMGWLALGTWLVVH